MKKTLFLAALLLAVSGLAAAPAHAYEDVVGDFDGKTKCENGMEKAGFKDPDTGSIAWHTLNDIAHAVQQLSWDDPMHPMDFDTRESRKVQLKHVEKILRGASCDTSDDAAQSDGSLPGAKNSTQNGTKLNGYAQSPVPQQ